MNKIQEKLVSSGCCDERGVGFAASAGLLPNGTWGLVLLCLKGDELDIYDVDSHTELKRLLYRIPLKSVEQLKIKGLVLKKLKFKYNGFEYSFNNLLGLNAQLAVIEQESRA